MAPPDHSSAGSRPPGFNRHRLVVLMRSAVDRCRLDLSGMTVLTEAASGAYTTTPVIAAIAGASHVYAFVRDTAYGTVGDVRRQTCELARSAGVADRITVFDSPPTEIAGEADILTNSGHLRPIDGDLIAQLPQRAVVALMYEAWELRPSDIDLAACKRRGIPVVAVNERHPSIDVFSYLGPLAVKLLHDAGIAVYGSRIALLCDNPFEPFIAAGLRRLGAEVATTLDPASIPAAPWDAIVVALRPTGRPVIGTEAAAAIGAKAKGAVIAQYWGDLDRAALGVKGIPIWPQIEPKPGHMGILLSDLGPEPVIRLQSGGLRAAELVYRYGTAVCQCTGQAELLPA